MSRSFAEMGWGSLFLPFWGDLLFFHLNRVDMQKMLGTPAGLQKGRIAFKPAPSLLALAPVYCVKAAACGLPCRTAYARPSHIDADPHTARAAHQREPDRTPIIHGAKFPTKYVDSSFPVPRLSGMQ